MTRLVILLGFIAYATADVKHLTDRNIDLFKYDPSDVYTLPEDIDDDKPAVFFTGDVMKARTEHLQSINGNKKYKLDLKTQNGIEVTSVGKLKDDKKTFVVSGSYSFTGADGKRYKTRYTADEFGYHPITELELDIPEPQIPNNIAGDRLQNEGKDSFGFGGNKENEGRNSFGSNKNRFQFLNQDLSLDLSNAPEARSSQSLDLSNAPERGSSQIGDDYSYAGADGYNYQAPQVQFEIPSPSIPSRQYLPVQ